MHEFLVMPSRNMGREDADFAVCCAVRVDEPGITIVSRPAGRPGEKVEKTDKQKAADAARHAEYDERAARQWGKLEPTPLNKLKLCEAYLARLTLHDPPDRDAVERLRDAAAAALRIADAIEVLNDPHLVGMVRHLFGEKGLARLRSR